MCFIGVEPPTIWNAQVIRARKRHECEECSHGIASGEFYERVGALYDRSWSTFRTCLSCRSLREAVYEHEIAEGCDWDEAYPPIGEVWESAIEAGVVVRRGTS